MAEEGQGGDWIKTSGEVIRFTKKFTLQTAPT